MRKHGARAFTEQSYRLVAPKFPHGRRASHRRQGQWAQRVFMLRADPKCRPACGKQLHVPSVRQEVTEMLRGWEQVLKVALVMAVAACSAALLMQ